MFKKISTFVILSILIASVFYSISLKAQMMGSEMSMSDGNPTMMQNCMNMMIHGLGSKDANYDKRFIDMMIPHHEGAIAMAKDALKKSNRIEIKKLAQNIITAQEKEISQMKKWRKEWYGQ